MALHQCSPDFRLSGDECGLHSGWTSRRHVVGDPPPQFSQEEWNIAAEVAREVAESDRMVAEHIQAESTRLVDETRELDDQAEADLQHRFSEKVSDFKHWIYELKRRFEVMDDELDVQLIYKRRLEIFIEEMCHIIQIDHTIIGIRNQRLGVDLVYDQPQQEIVQEMQVVEGVREVLKRAMEQTVEQIRIIRKTILIVSKDVVDKEAALIVEEYAQHLHTHRSEVKRQPRLFLADPDDECCGEDWEELAHKTKMLSEKAITSSQQLRSKVDSLIRQSYQDIHNQIYLVDRAFDIRQQELYKVKEKLQTQLSEIGVTVRDLDCMIPRLERAFEEKKSLIALAETRINIRSRRQNKEACNDAIQLRLILEIDELNQAMLKLNTKILQSKNALRSLLRTQLAMEDAINVKINTIAVDDTQAVPLRKSIRLNHY